MLAVGDRHEPRLDPAAARSYRYAIQFGLAHLAVVDDVDPCLGLPPDDVARPRRPASRSYAACVVVLAALHRGEEVEQLAAGRHRLPACVVRILSIRAPFL